MTCLYAENTPQTAYHKGCRCERCRAGKRESMARRPPKRFPCRDCGGSKPYRVIRCDKCARANAVRRTLAMVRFVDSCWLFTGQTNRWGYGRIRIGREQVVAHRITYEHFVGPVPDGLELDHLCANPACVNPEHLEAVTHQENVQRGHRRRATYARESQPVGPQTFTPPGFSASDSMPLLVEEDGAA